MSELRDELVAGIHASREKFESAGDRAEELRTLPHDAVALLRSLGLFWLKTPAELGGTPLPPVEFCDVIEELAYVDTSTAWAAMIGAGCNGLAGGWLPEEGAHRVFGNASDAVRPVIAGQLAPRGTGHPVKGGYLVSGRWAFSSGIVHADWIIGAFKPDGDDPGTSGGGELPAEHGAADTGFGRMVVFVAPRDDADVIDTWHVAGLQGTGSLDFRLSDVFVPASMTYVRGGPAFRGGALSKQPGHLFVDNEVPPLAVGLARRALSDVAELSGRTARFPGEATLRERAAFHSEIGRAWARVRAARAVYREAISSAWAATPTGAEVPARLLTDAATASVYTVETCAEVVADLFRYGGPGVVADQRPAAAPAGRAGRPAARVGVRGALRGGRTRAVAVSEGH